MFFKGLIGIIKVMIYFIVVLNKCCKCIENFEIVIDLMVFIIDDLIYDYNGV